ncbi:Fatty-acid and retinol-binding protein 1 [Aphelenchoides avenae]|nr:Fatty-acid and retinol-binding protein 1 [Aphelenchus avenae]
MDLRILALIAALSCVVYCFEFNVEDMPQEFRDFIPKDMQDLYKSLTPAEIKTLKRAHARHVDTDQIMASLKKIDPKLFEKVNKLWLKYKAGIDRLNPDAKEFAEEVLRNLNALRASGQLLDKGKMKDAAGLLVLRYDTLDDDAKSSIKQQFPQIAKTIDSEWNAAVD